MNKYDPKNCYHQKVKYLTNWREVISKLDRIIVAGRTMTKKEFIAMMEDK